MDTHTLEIVLTGLIGLFVGLLAGMAFWQQGGAKIMAEAKRMRATAEADALALGQQSRVIYEDAKTFTSTKEQEFKNKVLDIFNVAHAEAHQALNAAQSAETTVKKEVQDIAAKV